MICTYISDKGITCRRKAHNGSQVCSDCAHSVHSRMFRYLVGISQSGFAMELDREFDKVYGKVG